MKDDYLLPNHLKKILEENTSESVSKNKENNKEKFADRKSIIDEKKMLRIVNIFLK